MPDQVKVDSKGTRKTDKCLHLGLEDAITSLSVLNSNFGYNELVEL